MSNARLADCRAAAEARKTVEEGPEIRLGGKNCRPHKREVWMSCDLTRSEWDFSGRRAAPGCASMLAAYRRLTTARTSAGAPYRHKAIRTPAGHGRISMSLGNQVVLA